ncbi:IclR family transcriptional regulator [Cupriavidus sp. IDO]|uniref:IclR family transcriptional regulator n=1 Tax=Cupriavidus sp. IDO TaxID=1539142 RepID=UPI00068E2A71|nr:helix-turn-helix domain-containing protein [Cupriavidus sp. IDO]KWR91543.1 IclR family transcriptional regulator [Cupriavidus sp. IDO]
MTNAPHAPLAPPPAAADADGEARLVSALARGISILSCFSPTVQDLSSRELMERTGLAKPTLFRLLDTLCELGLLRYSERLSRYVPGVGLVNLAAPALARMTVRQLARPLMQELADHIAGQVELMVGYGNTITYVEIAQGVGSRVYRPEVGTRVSMSRTGSGRAYLSMMGEAERSTYLAQLRANDAEREAWLQGRLAEAALDLEEHGFCRGHRDLHREVESIAVPMRTRRDGEAWLFAASVPVFSQQSKQMVEDVGPRLVSLVRNVEGSLGAAG